MEDEPEGTPDDVTDALAEHVVAVVRHAQVSERIYAAARSAARLAQDIAEIDREKTGDLLPEIVAALEHVQEAAEALTRAFSTASALADVRAAQLNDDEGSPS